MDDEGKITQPDAENVGVTAEADALALLDETPGVGGTSLVRYRNQRASINAIISDQVGETAAERAKLRSKLVEIANKWLHSANPKLESRGEKLAIKLERLRLRTLDSVTHAVNADRLAMVEDVRLLKLQGRGNGDPKEGTFQTVAEIVAALERESKVSNTERPDSSQTPPSG